MKRVECLRVESEDTGSNWFLIYGITVEDATKGIVSEYPNAEVSVEPLDEVLSYQYRGIAQLTTT